jgi:hypothetical protein
MSSSTAIGACTTLPSSFHFHLAIRYSPVTNRCRFRLGRGFALPFIPSPVPCPLSHSVSVPRPTPLVPFCFRPLSPVPCPAQGG